MKKTMLLFLLSLLLLTGCASETPAPIPPAPPSVTPDQAVQAEAYPPPPAPSATQGMASYPEPEQPAAVLTVQTVEPTPYPEMAATATPADPEDVVRELADRVINALKEKNVQAISSLVHPADGLRFSPYSYVNASDLFFIAAKLPSLMDNPNQYVWGTFAGSGEPINMTFADYFDRFVYDVDFSSAPQVSLNERLGQGNTLDNTHEFYPGALIVEYHFPGFDEQYGGMDWRSLRLVFMDYKGRWVLTGIIHDEWTP